MSGCGDTLCAADSPRFRANESLSFPKGTLFPLPPSSLFGPSLPPSLHLSVSGGEKMEHGNYGNCIRQVLGRSLPLKHLNGSEEYGYSLMLRSHL